MSEPAQHKGAALCNARADHNSGVTERTKDAS